MGFAISRYVVPIGGSAAGVRSGRPSAAHSEVMDYVHALRCVEPVLSPPTSSLAEFLRDTEPTLDEIARVLAGPEPPRWEARIDRRTDDLGPYWIDHLHLHRLLVAAAAQAEHRGQSASAQRWIDAAWRLRESLDDSPSVIEQLVALAELHDEVALLRAIPRPLPGWERRLAPLPLRRRLMTAARLEAWGLAGALRQYLTEDLPDWVEAPPTVLARPQARRGVATVVASMDRAARRLESADSRPSDAVRVVAEELDSTPRWNVVARTLWSTPLVGEVWRKAARAELNLELTRRALVVRERLRSGDVEAVEALAGEHASVVAGVTWIYRVDPEAVVLRAGGDLDPLPAQGAPPLEIRLPRRGEAGGRHTPPE